MTETFARTKQEADRLAAAITGATGQPTEPEDLYPEYAADAPFAWRWRVPCHGLDYVYVRGIEEAIGMWGPAR